MKKLGEILIEKGLITKEQLDTALQIQKKQNIFLGEILINEKMITEDELIEALADQMGYETFSVSDIIVEDDILEKIPAKIAIENHILPVDMLGNSLTIVTDNPFKKELFNDLKMMTGMNIQIMLAPPTKLKEAIERLYKERANEDEDLTQLIEGETGEIEIVEEEENNSSKDDLIKMSESSNNEKLIRLIIVNALRKRASDIHIEPLDDKQIRIRYRIDSVLYEQKTYPIAVLKPMATVLKTKSGCKIDESRKPQNGRFKYNYQGRKLEFRVSFVPTVKGERVEIRIMDKKAIELNLNALGFNDRDLREIKAALKKPWGMILVVGPTGSGKTTTLYSMLMEMYDDFTNIMTVEEPVEFELYGINQVNVSIDEEAELASDESAETIADRMEHQMTFAKALKAFLRQDPDKIMVGEIRDNVTADIAIRAALTGHMVISSLHTNDAPSVITRLMNIGVPYFLIASSLICVVAQKLVRRICPKCKKEVTYTQKELENLDINPDEIKGIQTFYRGAGCSYCGNTGYYKRTAIFEVMPITKTIQNLIMNKASIKEIRNLAEKEGMLSLRAQAILKVKEGITTLEEVSRTTSGE